MQEEIAVGLRMCVPVQELHWRPHRKWPKWKAKVENIHYLIALVIIESAFDSKASVSRLPAHRSLFACIQHTIRQWTNFQSFHLVCLYSLWSGKKCCLSPLSSEFIECINMKIIGCATRTKLMDWNNTPFILSLYSLFIVFLICTLRRKWKTIMRYYEPFSY